MTQPDRHPCRYALVAVIAIVCAGCGRSSEPVALGIAGHANATPSIAASGRFVSVVWGATAPDRSSDVYASVSRDGGTSFSEPIRVSRDGMARLNGEQPPRVTLLERPGRDPAVVVVWTATGAQGTTLVQSRSDDGGVSFAPPAVVAASDAPGNRGWQAIASAAGGRVSAIWLDHRETASTAGEGTVHHDHGQAAGADGEGGAPDGAVRAQLSKLYFGWLDSGTPQAVTGGVCYCCKTALSVGANGTIYAAWRHVYPGNVRDIAFTMSADGGRSFAAPIRISNDGWVLNGCPENGPSVAVDAAGRIHVVWPTVTDLGGGEPALALLHAMSLDGRAFTTRQPLPTEGMARHVQLVAAPGGDIVAAWDEGSEGARRVAFAHGAPGADGVVRFARSVEGHDNAATYPVLAAAGDGILAAWTSGDAAASVIRVQPVSLHDR
jgi:hypothetical protein